MRQSPGDMLHGQYQIAELLASGGFGFVYRARDTVTGETVAIKELFPNLVGDSLMVQRFIQEARATLHLTHPNIARTHNIFQHGDTYYLVMEYLAGGSLADRLRRGPLPEDEAVRIMRALCTALEYAHGLGVVHCDLKPANVLFDAEGEVHLADFGIAHVSDDLLTRRMVTGTGVALGTVRYMAPEQLEGVRSDPRVDIYALGAILYEMLAGQPYLDFETETTPAAQMRNMQRIQREEPRPLRVANAAVPEWLAQVVERALRKAPAERFPTVVSLRQALEPALRLYVPPAGTGQLAQPRLAGWKWILLAGVAVLVILLLVSLGLLLSGPGRDTPDLATIKATTPVAVVVPTSTLHPTTEPDTPTPFIEEASDTPTPSPTVPTATPTPSDAEREASLLSLVRWRPQNGTPIFVYYADQPPVLDGHLETPGEWPGTRYEINHVVHGIENWSGTADLSGWCYLTWDDSFLYLGLEVRDDRHVQVSSGDLLYNGDDVEIQLDANLEGDWGSAELTKDDGQVGVTVRDLSLGTYEAWAWRPKAVQGPFRPDLGARATADGYVLEVALPWTVLNLSPQVKKPYGFCLSLADTDTPGKSDQESMVSTCPRRKWSDPTKWGTLTLVDW